MKKKASKNKNLIDLIKNWNSKTIYIPALVYLTGSIEASLLLCQIVYWWDKMNKKPFFKYKLPIFPKKEETEEEYTKRIKKLGYKIGDSWCEELCFSKEMFDTALNKIAYKKVNSRKGIEDIENTVYSVKNCISYQVHFNRKTFYTIEDEKKLYIILKTSIENYKNTNFFLLINKNNKTSAHAYKQWNKWKLCKEGFTLYTKEGFTLYTKEGFTLYPFTETTFTETTTETTCFLKRQKTHKTFLAKSHEKVFLNSSNQNRRNLEMEPKNISISEKNKITKQNKKPVQEKFSLSGKKSKSKISSISENDFPIQKKKPYGGAACGVPAVASSKESKPSKYMDYWNSLPNVQHHKNPNSKIYKRCEEKLKCLFKGTFYEKYEIDPEFINKHKIAPHLIKKDRKFSMKELERAGRDYNNFLKEGYAFNLGDGKFFPSGEKSKKTFPRSLDKFLSDDGAWKTNPTYRGGISWFLKVLSDPPEKMGEINTVNISPKWMRPAYKTFPNLSDSEKRTLQIKVLDMSEHHKKKFNWKKIESQKKNSFSYLGSNGCGNHRPLPFLNSYFAYLREQMEYRTNGYQITIYDVNVKNKLWQGYCQKIYDEHAIRIK